MSFTDDLIARMEPWMSPDLEVYLRAIGTMFSELDLYLGENDGDAWTILLDADRAPEKALPYLAQYVGERLPVGLTVAQQREWIKDAPNSKRGTVRAIFLAAQRKLTGVRVVSWAERNDPASGPNPEDHLIVHTYTAETPDPAGTFQDILSVSPADIEVHYDVLDGQSWADLDAGSANWAAVDAAYDDWNEAATAVAGLSSFSRPMP